MTDDDSGKHPLVTEYEELTKDALTAEGGTDKVVDDLMRRSRGPAFQDDRGRGSNYVYWSFDEDGEPIDG